VKTIRAYGQRFIQAVLQFRSNRKSTVFLICLALSTAIWFLIVLSKTHTTFVSFPVAYENIPEDQVLIKELPTHLSLGVQAGGFQLLGYKWFGSARTLTIDVSKYKARKDGLQYTRKIVTAQLYDELARQVKASIQLDRNYIFPDTIAIVSSDTMSKTVRLLPVVQTSFQKNYRLSGDIEVRPAVVEVFGPACILDTLQALHTQPLVLENLKETTITNVAIQNDGAYQLLQPSMEQAMIEVPVDAFRSVELSIPIQTAGLPDSISVQLFPDAVMVLYEVKEKDYAAVHANQFRAEVQFPDLQELDSSGMLRVNVVLVPETTELIHFSPQKVEVVWRRL